MSQRVAIIGAGVAGLLSIKSCLEEGLVPVCLERHDDLGGIWYYGDELRKGQVAATYDSVVTNISKEMLCFSDFPFPKEWPPFIPHKKVHQYLHSYAEHFGLKKYIRYNQDVLSIEKSGDDGWNVVSMNSDGRVKEIFDHLMVCTGIYNKIHYPSYPGLDEFTGIQIHANQYRNTTGLTNKRIVVVGAGFTAGEISCELARTGSTEIAHCQFNRMTDDGDNMQLYKYVFPVRVENPEKLAIIGMIAPFSAVWPCMELQARWATRVFTKNLKLPKKEEMLADIETKPKYGRRYCFINPFKYEDEIAEDIGVKPSFWKLLLSDPKLAMAFQYGPQLPYMYRLQGPGKWDGARDAILNAEMNTTSHMGSYRSQHAK
uniref:Flavin-containing monooxygenase n=1 Tax=Saccoglossus kowalevskii TaxID=10224 RepID=A0ABM0MTX5_SACKO|nr:PREDICTED: dimethylaniline monooxygenase [N-oxide-forming] 5-like [Saccoglossus kowalevskii]